METNFHFSGKNISIARQEGAVLITSLILLVVMTMLGISAIESTKLETRMVANVIEYNRTFQIAEAGLRTASKTYIDNETLLGKIEQKGIWIDAQPSEYQEHHGKADLCFLKSGIQKQVTKNTVEEIFVVESTGCSTTDCNDAVQVKLSAGLVLKGFTDTDIQDSNENKATMDGFLNENNSSTPSSTSSSSTDG
jgi:Tfp pilus assembly protein PilX